MQGLKEELGGGEVVFVWVILAAGGRFSSSLESLFLIAACWPTYSRPLCPDVWNVHHLTPALSEIQPLV